MSDNKAHLEQNYQGQVVLVTGGTKGIGFGIAVGFLTAGAEVIVCGRKEPETTPQALVNGIPKKAHFIKADVKDTDSTASLFKTIEEKFGRLDVLVNNAGGSPFALADKASPRFHESIIKLNLIAPLNVAQQANYILQKNGGTIIFIGSISAMRASPGTAAYGAAKAGILSLVKTLAVEWAPKVRVVALSPGLVKTESSHLHYGDDAGIAKVSATIPAGRMAVPEDIANACLFLASAQASYSSGCNLLLNGGGEMPAFLNANENN
ncbi:SDR family oxidoreductase [Aliiglaciecola lipolytica]|uniref:Short chain dehydrogenase n=1 Tax=Aliiglaciecola lipolytica E3 TaxID=1127673 RepID=K6YD00_9ALTE|nr:SDR family oxidoreductase [Aliiglaciecola lipolytica]GAC14518.1 short chain dehydrogenase [Aliiglaciecola lipolytica E3]